MKNKLRISTITRQCYGLRISNIRCELRRVNFARKLVAG